jgi:hypothetical protein
MKFGILACLDMVQLLDKGHTSGTCIFFVLCSFTFLSKVFCFNWQALKPNAVHLFFDDE